MEPVLVVALLAAVVAVGVLAAALALGRRDRLAGLERLRAASGAASPSVDSIESRIRATVDAAAAAERELAVAAADLAAVSDLVGSAAVGLDAELVVTSANAAAHALADRRPGTMVGRTVIEAFVDGRIEAIAAAARDASSAAGEVVMAPPTGPTLLVRARRDAGGGVWLVLDDVTELRRLQRIRAEFVDNLSHELRTPIATVSLLSEALSLEADAAGGAVPERMRERIAKIEVETGHLAQMISELLDLARIEGGGAPLLIDEVDVAGLVRDTSERLRPFADRQGVALGVELPDGLPAVRGDEDRLGQVLVNLLHNAVKFSPPGGVVTVRARAADGEIVVSVEDRGIGIGAADRPRVFERFYKADRARARGGGTGLGLSIARHIVEAHGGRISLVSEEGSGSTFSFSLPLSGPAAAPAGGPGAGAAAE